MTSELDDGSAVEESVLKLSMFERADDDEREEGRTMAWIDDRIWCHPKFTDVSADAFTAYVKGLAYSSGFGTGGHLTPGQLKVIGASEKDRVALIAAGLWEVTDNGVVIHDWDEHNSHRDERRERERERKRRGARGWASRDGEDEDGDEPD